jgi:DNA mismatch repair protein MutS2
MLEQLEQSQRLARIAQGEADRRSAELKRAEELAAKKLAEADEVRRTAHSRAQALIDEALREIRLEAAQIFEDVKNAPRDSKAQDEARRKLKELQQVGIELAEELTPVEKRTAAPASLKKGDSVKVEGYTQVGTLLADPKDGNATVQIGSLKFTVPVASLTSAKAPVSQSGRGASAAAGLRKAQTARTEIHLRAMRAEDAQEELEQFLDDAVLGGLHQVRIVHGKGEGILRKVTREVLRRYAHVSSFRDGEPSEGGQGVTIAVLA